MRANKKLWYLSQSDSIGQNIPGSKCTCGRMVCRIWMPIRSSIETIKPVRVRNTLN